MRIKAEYRDGVFTPLQEVDDLDPGEASHVFSDCELKRPAGRPLRPVTPSRSTSPAAR